METKVSLVSLMKIFMQHQVIVKCCVHETGFLQINKILAGTGMMGPDFILYNLDTQSIFYIDSWQWEDWIEAAQKKAKAKLNAYQA
jgi:hypothetical protein